MKKLKNNGQWQYIVVALSVIVLILFGGWYWYSQSYLKPENVFWNMLDRGLQVASVTKTINTQDSDQAVSMVTKLQFKSQLISQTTVDLRELSDSSKLVSTETIGTTNRDYLRYKGVNSIKDKVINQWAAESATDTYEASILYSEIISSPVMFGYLPASSRQQLINRLKSDKVFDVDYLSTNTSAQYKNKKVFIFDVKIDLNKFAAVYIDYLKTIGLKNIANQIEIPQTGNSLDVNFLVDPKTHRLQQITYKSKGVTEDYSSYDTNNHIQEPENIKMTFSEMETAIAKLNQNVE